MTDRSTIRTTHEYPGMWSAIDSNRYDGAPDGDTTTGYGRKPRPSPTCSKGTRKTAPRSPARRRSPPSR